MQKSARLTGTNPVNAEKINQIAATVIVWLWTIAGIFNFCLGNARQAARHKNTRFGTVKQPTNQEAELPSVFYVV